MHRLSLAVLALALLVGDAAAQTYRIPYENNYSATAGDADATIRYFNTNGTGASATTNTAANRQEVWNLSILNDTASSVTIRIYSKASPGWDGAFSDDWNDDYAVFIINAGDALTLTDRTVPVIGWHIVTDTFVGTSPNVNIAGWN